MRFRRRWRLPSLASRLWQDPIPTSWKNLRKKTHMTAPSRSQSFGVWPRPSKSRTWNTMLPTLGLRNLWRFWRRQMPAPFCLWNPLLPCTTRALAFQSENISRSMMWPLWLPRPPSSPKEPWWNLIALWHRGKTQALGSHRVKCRRSCGCLISASASFRCAWILGTVWQLQIGAILSFKTLLTTAKCTMCNRDALIAQRRSFEALISSGRWRAHRGYSMLDSLCLIPWLWLMAMPDKKRCQAAAGSDWCFC